MLGTSILGTLMTSRFEERLAALGRPRPQDVAQAFTDAVGRATSVGAAVLLAGAVAGGLLLTLAHRRRAAVAVAVPAQGDIEAATGPVAGMRSI